MSKVRKLAAIMFTDIVGFTALMGSDEQKTFEILEKNRQIHKPIINEHKGRWIKELGDGVMASFDNVSDAVNAAIKIMDACNTTNDYQLSIGIHLAEVVFENDDVFGDGVNIAARIESVAPPGCILISESVHRNIANKKDIQTRFVKEAELKNVNQHVRLYQVLTVGGEIIKPEENVVPIEEKSIAVLPFVNMSSDPEQDYFSDGISEEIINKLAQIPALKVTGRTSSFSFRGKGLDLQEIGKKLKVSHILEGSVRKSGNTLRITAQLIKVSDGFHMYSKNFDRELEDVFAIQDEISEAIQSAVKISLVPQENNEILRKYTDNVEAYQHYIKGRFHFNKYEWPQAIESYQSAIKIDSNYAIAYAHMSTCYTDMAFQGLFEKQNRALAEAAAEKALELDDQSSESHYAMGRIKFWHNWDFKSALYHLDKAIQINPNNVEALQQLGRLTAKIGKYEDANQYLEKAENLDPFSLIGLFYASGGYMDMGNWTKVEEYANRMIDIEPNFFGGHLIACGVLPSDWATRTGTCSNGVDWSIE